MIHTRIFSLLSGVVCLLLLVFSAPITVHGQATDCNIDLSEVTALLTQAQAKASAGNAAAAKALLQQAGQKLSQLESQCGVDSATPAPSGIALTQTFDSAEGKFSVKYPSGWFVSPLPTSGGDKAQISPIFLGSDQASVDAFTRNKVSKQLKGVALVVGTPVQVAITLGVFDQKQTYNQITPEALLAAIVQSTSQSTAGGTFGSIKKLQINTQEAAEAPFTFVATSSTGNSYDGVILIFKLANDKFATFLGVITPGQTAEIEVLTREIAATLKLNS